MAVIVAYNVYNALSLHTEGTRVDVCAGMSEFACDLTIGAATTINVMLAVGAGLIGVVALIVWRTRDLYREIVEPVAPNITSTVPDLEPSDSLVLSHQPQEQEHEQVTTDIPKPFGFVAKDGYVELGDGTTHRLTPIGLRLVGFVIDLVAIVLVTELIFRPAEDVTSYLISWLFGLAYWSLCHAGPGQTLGKLICGAKVLKADTGATPSLPAAFGRAFTLTLLAPIVAAPVLWKPSRRGWHDDAANTVVVVKR